MAKVTSKLQVTIPKRLAESYGIAPGDDITFVGAGDAIRVIPPRAVAAAIDPKERLRLFDAATARQRQRRRRGRRRGTTSRDWTRAELYERGRAG